MTTPRSFAIRGRPLLPIVQGGMGVGVSAHRLAGAVARAGAVGTIASIDLRHHHANKELFFRGSERLPFGRAIRSVQELIDYFMTGLKPALA